VEGGFGWWCRANDPAAFADIISQACAADLSVMREKELAYLEKHYTVSVNAHLLTDER